MFLQKGAQLFLVLSILLCSCARQASITDLIKDKKHDRDGIYYIEYKKPKDPAPIDHTLTSLGYTVKEAYYWSGLEKKTDKYKFLWFYGEEYESLKEVRAQERQRDSLLSNKDMASFIMAQKQYPQFPIENPEEEALNYLKTMEDISLYHREYGDSNLEKTEPYAQELVTNVEKLLLYRNTYGVSEFTESKIMGFLENVNLAEAKILVENFTDSRHIKTIELTHLSKSKNISDFALEPAAKKYFDVDPNFPFGNKKAVIALVEKLNQKLLIDKDITRLTYSCYDLHIEKNIPGSRSDFKKIELFMEYAENNEEWLGKRYVQNREIALVRKINNSNYGKLPYFNQFNNEVNKILNQWAWKGGYKYGHKLILVESYKGALRKEQSTEGSGSALDNILFEKVDNMVFKDIVTDTQMDDLSYIRMAGNYSLKNEERHHLPFHAIFTLDENSTQYALKELVITDYGVYNTHYNGKKKNKVFYYDKKSGSLKRKGK